MTGFGAASGEIQGVSYAVEVRSVNNRYLKPAIRLPECIAGFESELESLLRNRLTRGSVTLTVRMKVPQEQAASRVNMAAINSYLDQLRQLEVEGNSTLRIDLAGLLALPGVCEPPPLEELAQAAHDGLVGLIEKALAGLIEMRTREGRTLALDLDNNCRAIEQQLAMVAEKAPGVVKDYHRRLADRVAELTNAGKIDMDAEALAREVAIFAERCDIAEEISRLRSHVEHFRKAMAEPEPAGRKIDFIAQEMLREANTIASKAADAAIARAVVEMKTAIDRIKEQAANVE